MKNNVFRFRGVIAALIVFLICQVLVVSAAAYSNDEVLFSEDFDGTTLSSAYFAGAYVDGLTVAELSDGRLHLSCSGSKAAKTTAYCLYQRPDDLKAYSISADFMVDQYGTGDEAQRSRPLGIAFNLPGNSDITWQAAVFAGVETTLPALSGYQDSSSIASYRWTEVNQPYIFEDDTWYTMRVDVDDKNMLIDVYVKIRGDLEWVHIMSAVDVNARDMFGFGPYIGIINRGNDIYVDNFTVKAIISAEETTDASTTAEVTTATVTTPPITEAITTPSVTESVTTNVPSTTDAVTTNSGNGTEKNGCRSTVFTFLPVLLTTVFSFGLVVKKKR